MGALCFIRWLLGLKLRLSDLAAAISTHCASLVRLSWSLEDAGLLIDRVTFSKLSPLLRDLLHSRKQGGLVEVCEPQRKVKYRMVLSLVSRIPEVFVLSVQMPLLSSRDCQRLS